MNGLEQLVEAARRVGGRKGRFMRHAKLVKPWWPKPRIFKEPEKWWGNKWQNGSGCRNIYRCESHSTIGFATYKENPLQGGPSLLCFSYGESPEHAYDEWCELFNSWNKEKEWVK